MYYIKKTIEVAGSHQLKLNYESKCTQLHGHNWIITIYAKGEKLNENGMLIDFTHIKEMIHNKLDHKHLNDLFDFNPSAENIAKWVVDQSPLFYRADVIESTNNEATYEI